MKRKRNLLLLLVAAMAAAAMFWYWGGPGQSPEGPRLEKTGYLYIGLVAPQSGPLSEIGQCLVRGAEMAVDEVNAQRGDGRRPFKLLVEDEAASDIPATNRLANDPRVKMIVGHLMERTLEEATPIYLAAGRPVLLPVISDVDAANLGPGQYFQMMPSDEDQAKALAEYARTTLAVRQALVVFEDSKYGRLLADAFAKELRTGAGTTVDVESYPEEPEALLDLTRRARDRRYEAIFLALHSRPAIFIAQALARAEFKPTLLGTHALALNDVVAIFDRLTDQAFFSLPFNPLNPGEPGKAFVAKYAARYQGQPNWLSVQAYDAVMAAARAIDAAKGDAQKLRSTLTGINQPGNGFQGVAGDYVFNASGRVRRPVYIVPSNASLLGRIP